MTRKGPKDPVEIGTDLSDADRAVVQVGMEFFCRRLESLGDAAMKVGKDQDAKRYKDQAEGLRAEIVDVEPADVRLYEHQRAAVVGALEEVKRHCIGAKGPVAGLRKVHMVKELEEDMEYVEGSLLPLFRVQPDLPGLTLEKSEPVAAEAGAE